MVVQKLVIRNPPNAVDSEHAPEEGYVMWGTVPLPRGTDPDTLGNNFAALGYAAYQQHRQIAHTRNHDIYEWFVYNPGSLGRQTDTLRNEVYDTVFLSETYKRPPQLGKKNQRVRSSTGGHTYGPSPINGPTGLTSLFESMNGNLDYLGGARLVISGLANNDTDDVNETVFLTGNCNKIVRAGDCAVTRGKHVNTVNFGSFHIYWTVMRGRMDYQVTIHWHNGIPRSDVLVKSIKLVVKGTHEDVGNPELAWTPAIVARSQPGTFNGTWNIWSEWSEPAMSIVFTPTGFDTYLLKPHAEGKYYPFPRMARRTWRLILSPQRPGGVFIKPQVYPGWGVGVWQDGGFLADKGRVWPTMFAHIKDTAGKWTAPDVVTSWTQTVDSELFNLIDTDNKGGGTTPNTVSVNQVHLPGTGQRYGGPTGADDKYRPYAGIKALGANERAGLVEHSIMLMRHYARDWAGMYETNGDVVNPIAHCNPPGSDRGDWSAGGQAGFNRTGGRGVYGVWTDAGFGWSSTTNRRIRTKGTAGTLVERVNAQWSMPGTTQDLRLQTYVGEDAAAFVPGQGWDNWDTQHRGIGWGHAGALYWLTGDEISRLYILGEAELANMTYWHGSGNAGTGFNDATAPGETVQVGRDMGWSMAAIARACMLEPLDAVDSNDTTNALSQRAARWMTGPLRRFVVNTEMGATPAGIGWHTGAESTSKSFETPPFNSQWYVHQLFEMDYSTHALQWADDAAPSSEWFKSTRFDAQATDPQHLMREWLRGVDALWTVEAVTPTAMAVLVGGSGYTNGDTVYVSSDKDRWGTASPGASTECQLTLAVSGGVVTGTTIAVPGNWASEVYEGNDAFGFGAVPYARTRPENAFDGLVTTTPGGGYQVGQTYKVVGGRPLGGRDNWYMRVRIEQVNASGGIVATKVIKMGRYEQPPTNPILVYEGQGTVTSSGWVGTVPLSASGVGLRVNPTWSAPFKSLYAGSVWKIAPLRKYPTGPSWASRTEWDGLSNRPPRDLCIQPGLRDRGPGQNPQIGGSAQENNAPAHQTALAHTMWCGSPLAAAAVCEYFGVSTSPQPDLNAVRTILKNRGFGQLRAATSGPLIDFWWPIYSALGPG